MLYRGVPYKHGLKLNQVLSLIGKVPEVATKLAHGPKVKYMHSPACSLDPSTVFIQRLFLFFAPLGKQQSNTHSF